MIYCAISVAAFFGRKPSTATAVAKFKLGRSPEVIFRHGLASFGGHLFESTGDLYEIDANE